MHTSSSCLTYKPEQSFLRLHPSFAFIACVEQWVSRIHTFVHTEGCTAPRLQSVLKMDSEKQGVKKMEVKEEDETVISSGDRGKDVELEYNL